MSADPDVVCAFCGQGAVRRDDPEFGRKAAEHIRTCVQHPLHQTMLLYIEAIEACKVAAAAIRDRGTVVGPLGLALSQLDAVIAKEPK